MLGLKHCTSVESQGPAVHPEATPQWLIVNYEHPAIGNRGPVKVTWYHGDHKPPQFADGTVPNQKEWQSGSLFVGEKGMLLTDYGKHLLLPQDQFKEYKRPAPTIAKSVGHHREWINACKGGPAALCNFDYAGVLTETALLGNVAHRVGKRLEWDAVKLKATNAPEADAYLRREYRKGWELAGMTA